MGFNPRSFVMSRKRDIHVVPRSDGWAKIKEGADRAGGTFDTQGEAIESAREQARRENVEVVIHRPDGRIRDSDSYGNDPFPPRDTKR
jgi:Uncharacterized protein conserved in bacteria (DUF2188)